jgi:hypothetical protein
MIHYHGTPITPISALLELHGRHFCVSHAAPADVSRCHQIGQSVMLDNGAFSAWKTGKAVDWSSYYAWTNKWLDCPTTWAVIPDVITGSDEDQDALIAQWPHGHRGVPVWHMHESIDRLVRLTLEWPKVCIGSSAQYAVVLSSIWVHRMDAAWNAVEHHHRRTPAVHMLRGMALSGRDWPFASVDSTDIARNHHLAHKSPRKMADRWDGVQCPHKWVQRPEQMEMI